MQSTFSWYCMLTLVSEVWHTFRGGGSKICEFVTGGRGGSKILKKSVTYFMDLPLFWTPPPLLCYARVRRSPIWGHSTHPGLLPIQDVDSGSFMSIHSTQGFLFLSSLALRACFCAPPPFYRLIPNHPHSYLHPDAQWISICNASHLATL